MESEQLEIKWSGYIPSWRRKKKRQEPLALRMLLGVCSGIGIFFVLIPTREGYHTPLSMEWAAGTTLGYLRLGGLGLTMAVLAGKLLARRCWVDALSCLVPIAALTYLANSPPLSSNHLGVFVALVTTIIGWHWILAARMEDSRLAFMAILATLAATLCGVALGPGERILAVVSIVTANLAFYEHAPPVDTERLKTLYIP